MRLIALLAPLLCLALPAAAAVSVAFEKPESYTDAGLYSDTGARARVPTLEGLRKHFEKLATRLPEGRELKIEVLDIDLAGRFEPWRLQARDIRIMRDVSWPRIRLRYALAEGNRVLAQGEETIADLAYLWRPEARQSSDALAYEKAMLNDWFRARILQGKPRVAP